MWARALLVVGLGFAISVVRAEPEQIISSVFEPAGGTRATEYLSNVTGERRLVIVRPGESAETIRNASEPLLVAHAAGAQSLFFRIEVGPVKSVVWRQYPSREQIEFGGATGYYKHQGDVAVPTSAGLNVIAHATGAKSVIAAPFQVFAPNLVATKSAAGVWELRRWTSSSPIATSPTPFVAATDTAWLTGEPPTDLPLGFAVDSRVAPTKIGERMMFGIVREEAFGPGHVMNTARGTYDWRERVDRYLMLDDGFQLENGPWINPLVGTNFAVLEEPLQRPWRGGAYRRRFWRVDLRTYDYLDLKFEAISAGKTWQNAAWLRTKGGFQRVDLATGEVTNLAALADRPTRFMANQAELLAVAKHEVYSLTSTNAKLISPPGTEYRYVATPDPTEPTSQQLYVRVEREVGGQAGVAVLTAGKLQFSDMSATISARRGLYGLTFLQQDFAQPPRVLSDLSGNADSIVAESNLDFDPKQAGVRQLLQTSWRGQKLAGNLLSPDGEVTPRPVVIYIYDRMAGRGFEFPSRDPREPYSVRSWLDAGYHVLLPDLAFQSGNPGSSVVGCLREWLHVLRQNPAIDMGRVGVIGHSWGGYGALFAATQMPELRCVVAGAPITDLASLYYSSYGGGTEPNNTILEFEQGRMGTSPDRDPAAYRRNSPLTHLPRLKVPVLAAYGENDELVTPAQHEMLYHALWEHRRRSLVVRYRGDNHAISKPENRADYRRRIDLWFRHHLGGETVDGLGW